MFICYQYIFFGQASVQTVHLLFYLVVYLITEISLCIFNISSSADCVLQILSPCSLSFRFLKCLSKSKSLLLINFNFSFKPEDTKNLFLLCLPLKIL